jgi:hypothetical protein
MAKHENAGVAFEVNKAMTHTPSKAARRLASHVGDAVYDTFSHGGDLQGQVEYELSTILDVNEYVFDRDELEVLVDRAVSNAFFVMSKTIEEQLDEAINKPPPSPTKRSKKKYVKRKS